MDEGVLAWPRDKSIKETRWNATTSSSCCLPRWTVNQNFFLSVRHTFFYERNVPPLLPPRPRRAICSPGDPNVCTCTSTHRPSSKGKPCLQAAVFHDRDGDCFLSGVIFSSLLFKDVIFDGQSETETLRSCSRSNKTRWQNQTSNKKKKKSTCAARSLVMGAVASPPCFTFCVNVKKVSISFLRCFSGSWFVWEYFNTSFQEAR